MSIYNFAYFIEFLSNPTPGIIINHPKGKDVYKGIPKDYTGQVRIICFEFFKVINLYINM